MCVVDLPDRWEEVKAACKTTRELEAELVPNVAQVEAGLGTSNEKIAKVEEVQAAHTNDLATHAQRASAIEEEHSRFVAQHAKLQEKVIP